MDEFIVLSTAVFIGAVVSGFAGFAFSAAAGAILLHYFEPALVIPLMMLCSVASQVTTLIVLRRYIRWREAKSLLLGGGVGVPIALYMFSFVDAAWLRTLFGLLLAAYALYLLRRIHPRQDQALQRFGGRVSQSVIGFAGGFVGAFTAMPGAVVTVWCDLRGNSKEQQRGLVQPFIIAMQVLALILLFSYPQAAHKDLLHNTLLAIPALAAGTFVGLMLFGRITDKLFRICVLLLLLVSGCSLVHWHSFLSLAAQAASIFATS